jgi:probable rRNA maturation factor
MSPEDHLVLFRRVPRDFPRKAVEEFAEVLRRRVAGGRQFSCLITGDTDLRRLNRDFLGKDYPTDVLSFPSPGEAETLGEIAISAARAREQAEAYGHEQAEEIKILMLHGLLHLMGMEHERDQGKMARAERQWRTKLALPNGLIERSTA